MNQTEWRGYSTPHPDNQLDHDVENIRTAIEQIDGDIHALNQANSLHVIEQSADGVKLGQANVFATFAEVPLPSASDGAWLLISAQTKLDLTTGDCALLAPAGEQFNLDGEQFERLILTETRTEFRIFKHNGEWHA